MAEELWDHALQFLDKYRTDISSHDIRHLYQFQDSTGILERHREMFENIFMDTQVDMKIIFYELIRMLVEHGKNEASEVYDDTKTIPKIEGYQELTNKSLRNLCKSRFIDLQELKSVNAESNENSKNRFGQLESKLEQIEKSSRIAIDKIDTLEIENKWIQLKP